MASTVRVSDETHRALKEIALQSNRTIQQVLAEAVEAYQRVQFFREVNEAYAALRANPAAWREELDERADWDSTLADGLSEE